MCFQSETSVFKFLRRSVGTVPQLLVLLVRGQTCLGFFSSFSRNFMIGKATALESRFWKAEIESEIKKSIFRCIRRNIYI